jgi:DNA repair exonuclease SbcCD nuclease subunit
MTENLFKRAALFGDLHLGKKNNDRQFNIDCEHFVKWFVETAKERNCDAIIFLGDYFDNRNSIHISTLNYALSNLERLNNSGIPIYMIPGNHDEYYKDKREITSISIARNLNNITIFNELTNIGNVTFCPWLVGEEWKQIESYAAKSDYMFGHFELPRFLMNAMVEMPDTGLLNVKHFEKVKHMVFTGHFHKRQVRDNVCYIGSPFCHDYADVWDNDRGMVVLEWGQTPEFINYQNGPKYITMTLSELLTDPLSNLTDLTNAKISSDLDLSYEEINFIKEVFEQQFHPRRLNIVPHGQRADEQDFLDENVTFQSVDQIVIEGLKSVDSLTLDKNTLIDIYMSL